MSQPTAESMIWSILAREKSSVRQHLFRLVKSMHIHQFPFFLQTITTLANHFRYVTSLIIPASNKRCTSAFVASIFSSDILQSSCFLGFTFVLTCNLCMITSLQTPIKSKVDITILVQELHQLRLLLWAYLSSDAHSPVWYSGVKCQSCEITFSFNCLLEFCRCFLFG
jgi:hypothetical protein